MVLKICWTLVDGKVKTKLAFVHCTHCNYSTLEKIDQQQGSKYRKERTNVREEKLVKYFFMRLPDSELVCLFKEARRKLYTIYFAL
jgi:hypothetical protein